MLRVLVGSFLTVGLFSACSSQPPSQHFNAIVMDAGSTGTRVYVYDVTTYGAQTLPRVVAIANCKDAEPSASVPSPGCKQATKDRGIAALKGQPQSAMDTYLAPMIAFAKGQVPQGVWASTPIFLRATAGVRNLPVADQNELMARASESLEASGFLSRKAAVIAGTAEALYQWLNVNAIKGKLGGKQADTVGIIEIGGASEQIGFIEQKPTGIPINIGGTRYDFYGYSYNHLGVNEAIAIAANLPNCGLKTASVGYDACKAEWISQLSDNQFCTPLCGLEGVWQPSLAGSFVLVGGLASSLANGCGIATLNAESLDAKGEDFCGLAPTTWAPFGQPGYVASPEQKAICPGLGADSSYQTACAAMALLSTELSGSEGGSFKGFGFAKDTTQISLPDAQGLVDGQETTWTRGLLIFGYGQTP